MDSKQDTIIYNSNFTKKSINNIFNNNEFVKNTINLANQKAKGYNEKELIDDSYNEISLLYIMIILLILSVIKLFFQNLIGQQGSNVIIAIIGGLFFLKEFKCTKIKNTIYVANKDINIEPIPVKNKIKYIENNLINLERMNFDGSTLLLIKDSINLTILFCESNNCELLIDEINSFLNNIISSIEIINNNNYIEKELIKKELTDNINSLIQNNAELLELIELSIY